MLSRGEERENRRERTFFWIIEAGAGEEAKKNQRGKEGKSGF